MSLFCWILTDGRSGTENNARGLAEALGFVPQIYPIKLRQPWKSLSPWLRLGLKFAFIQKPSPPWPDLLITAGRTPAAGSLYVGQQSPTTLRVHITNPGISSHKFDLVITPKHDGITGSNILNTLGALHRVTTQKLSDARALWEPRFAHLPRPWHAILVGGNAHGLQLDAPTAQKFMQQINAQINALGGSSLVTASRRTSPEAQAEFAKAATYMWDSTGDNPYMGLLACADALFVTSDSVSMLSEAASTGKPTYLLSLPGHAPKLERCHQNLLAGGHIARFEGSLIATHTKRLDDMELVTTKVRELLVARGKLSH